MNLATNQHAKRRDRTNDYVCHLDHLLQLPWAIHQRVPPTEAARPKNISRMNSIAAPVKIFKALLPPTSDAPRRRHSLIYNLWKRADVSEKGTYLCR